MSSRVCSKCFASFEESDARVVSYVGDPANYNRHLTRKSRKVTAEVVGAVLYHDVCYWTAPKGFQYRSLCGPLRLPCIEEDLIEWMDTYGPAAK